MRLLETLKVPEHLCAHPKRYFKIYINSNNRCYYNKINQCNGDLLRKDSLNNSSSSRYDCNFKDMTLLIMLDARKILVKAEKIVVSMKMLFHIIKEY